MPGMRKYHEMHQRKHHPVRLLVLELRREQKRTIHKTIFERFMDWLCRETIKAVIFIAMGYTWAVMAYGIFT